MILAAEIDMSPLFSQVIWPALAVIATAIAGFVAKKISDWSGVKQEEAMRKMANDVLNNALQFAQAKVASSNIEHVQVQSQIVADAANYATIHAAEALKNVGLDLTTEAGKQSLKESIEARLAPAILVGTATPGEVSVAAAASAVNPAVDSTKVVVEAVPPH